jgi:outer membrane protein insertion porin family
MALAKRTKGSRLMRLAVILLLGLGGLDLTPGFGPAFAETYNFTSVKVTGNTNVDSATILAYAHIPKGTALTDSTLNDVYQRIVASGLFETVKLTPSGNVLTIAVTEYPMLNVVDFQGNSRVKDEDLAKVVQSKSAHVYSPAQAETDAAAIAAYYRDHGSIAATVDPKIIRRDGGRVDLVFEIHEGKVSELERVSFVGNKAFSDYQLRQVLATKQAGILRALIQRDTLVPDRLDQDKALLTAFYQSRGFMDFRILDVSAEVSRERDATYLTFTIEEGQGFKVGAVSTVSQVQGLDAAEFDAVRRLRPGVTYNPDVIDNNVARMETLAIKKGINFVNVDPVLTRHDAQGTVDVAFTLKRGDRVFIERIDIEGNTTTEDQVVRRQFDTVEGDPFNPREIRLASDRIRALGYFSDVKVTGNAGSAADKVVLKVDVTEQPTGSLSLGATYGVADGFGLNLGFDEKNFLGRGQQISVAVQTGTGSVNSHLNFTEPALLGRDLQFSIAMGYLTTNHLHAHYDTQSLTFQPGIDFPISETGRLGLHYRAAREGLTNIDGPVVDDPTTPVDETSNGSSAILFSEAGTQVESGIGYDYSFDSQRNGLSPGTGVKVSFGQDLTGLGGDATYVETTAQAAAQTKIDYDQVTLRATLEGGYLQGISGYGTRVTDRFFGNGKIRGFAPNGIGPRDLTATNQDALGGNIYAVARFDSEFPLGLPEEYGITGGAFLDMGSVWGLDNTNGTLGAVDAGFHLRSAIGLSVLWKTPIGPLRFNFSHALLKESYDKEQTFDLTISTQF